MAQNSPEKIGVVESVAEIVGVFFISFSLACQEYPLILWLLNQV